MTRENGSESRGKVTGVKLGRLRDRLEVVVEESDDFDNLSQAVREYVRRGVLREEIESRADESGEELATDGGREL